MFHHHRRSTAHPIRPELVRALGPAGRAEAERFLSCCPRHRPTPLIPLPGLAARLGIAALHVKDEGQRLGLRSFKALGGAYAVIRLVIAASEEALGRAVDPAELQSESVRAVAAGLTVACATDGNHGRAVAAGAKLAGCRAVIYLHGGVSKPRAAAIANFGAELRWVEGSYDFSVATADREAREHGWHVISDTAYEGYEDVPLTVMQGYTVMAGEALDEIGASPTHVFLQAGVGGMAAAVALYARQRLGDEAPRVVVVEPERAACLFESARAGRHVTIPHDAPTVMAMLECYEPSLLAWEILAATADGFVTVPEEAAVEVMRTLAKPAAGDLAIVAGESGGAGLAGLLTCLRDPAAVAALGLGPQSRVLVFNSEGATDEATYARLTGIEPAMDRP